MYKRILTIQDISCVGQCSLTVALPILSACGIETAILPTAVLSTHTAGFTGYTVRDLADDIPAITEHWAREGITFDAVYTGYLGTIPEIDMVIDIIDRLLAPGGKVFIDPAMADGGKLYPAFGTEYAEAMRALVAKADYVLPNITEAALLTGEEYRESYDKAYIGRLCEGLRTLGAKTVVLTGVGFKEQSTGIIVDGDGYQSYYEHRKISENRHGTGDIYSAAYVGAVLKGRDAVSAAQIAGDYTVMCLEETLKGEPHTYGAKFEAVLPELIKLLEA